MELMFDVANLGAIRPRIAPWFCSELVAGEGLYLIAEREDGVLTGSIYRLLAPFLDGSRTTDEVIDALDGAASAAEIYYAISIAMSNGYVIADPPLADASAERFWGASCVQPARAASVLREATVHLSAVGSTDLRQLGALLQDLGFATSADTGLDVVVVDDYLNPELAAVNAAHLASREPWLPAKLAGSVLWIGPMFVPGTSACWQCMAQRLAANREVSSYVQWRRGETASPRIPSGAVAPSASAGASLLALAISRHALGAGRPLSELTTIDLMSFDTKHHTVVRRPQCPACGDPAKAQRQVPITLQSGIKVFNADGSRTASPEATVERLIHHVSPVVGAVTELVKISDPTDPAMHVYYAGHNFAVRSRDLHYLKEGLRSKSSGKGTLDSQSRASAICEALERYSGIFQGDEPRIRSTYRKLGDDAIHPNASMRFSDRQYKERASWLARNSRFAVVPLPFDGDAEVEWTRVWSLTRKCWRWLPTGYLYYGYPHRADQFYYWADSNGNAAGNVLEEAILQGFLEVVERDAVCIWWYNRLRRPGLDLASFDDPWIDSLVRRYEQLGRPLWVLDVTSDLGIPAFVAASARIDKPVEDLIFACGAHLDPHVAVHRALGELNQFLPAVLPVKADGSGEYAFPDPDCQHWWRNATRANEPYMVPDPTQPARRLSDFEVTRTNDVREDIRRCQRMVEQRGFEMLVHDQTRPDLGISVAKVLVPGLRHFWARLGPGRLYDVPVQQGWLARPTPEADLNPVALFL